MPDRENEYRIRLAEVKDAAVIARHRAAMFHDMGLLSGDEPETLRRAGEPWIKRLLAGGEYVGWLVERDGKVVGGGGIHLWEHGPGPECLRVGPWAHVANVYTDPNHRRRGLARMVMEAILDYCAANSVDHVTLNPSDEAIPLYEALGFVASAQMRLARRRSL